MTPKINQGRRAKTKHQTKTMISLKEGTKNTFKR